MSASGDFDRLARSYRALEYLAFGRDLERARFAHLSLLRDRRSILVLGEGDGRCLERLVQAAPHARIDCLDKSAAMLARAARRLAGQAAIDRVVFRQADVLSTALPAATYDAVVTCFFLDCFSAEQSRSVLERIQQSLRPEALWLWADFALPATGWRRQRARLWLAVLYAFFRWQTGLGTRRLPPVEDFFSVNTYVPVAAASFQGDLVRSKAWRFTPPGAGPDRRSTLAPGPGRAGRFPAIP